MSDRLERACHNCTEPVLVCADCMFKELPALPPEPSSVQDLYNELLYAVARKFPGETRHQTALRYIREAEERALKEVQPKACNMEPEE